MPVKDALEELGQLAAVVGHNLMWLSKGESRKAKYIAFSQAVQLVCDEIKIAAPEAMFTFVPGNWFTFRISIQ